MCVCVCVSCQGGPVDIKVFTDNNRPTEPEGLKYGVAVTAPHYTQYVIACPQSKGSITFVLRTASWEHCGGN